MNKVFKRKKGLTAWQKKDQFIAWLCGEDVKFPYLADEPPKIPEVKDD